MKKIEDNDEIITIEGVGTKDKLHPLQIAWMVYGAAQCGYCTPGFIVSAKVLLEQNNNPTREEVRDWFQKNKNLCRCTGYKPLVDAVMDAAKIMTEMGYGGGVECECLNGYHLRENDLYFEIIDPITGQPVEDGVYGEVVFTTLHRQAMPLIRYRTGDMARFSTKPCACGTFLRTMEKVLGRMP